jgi:hypothetical protein
MTSKRFRALQPVRLGKLVVNASFSPRNKIMKAAS